MHPIARFGERNAGWPTVLTVLDADVSSLLPLPRLAF
jgi:hypothetical protein